MAKDLTSLFSPKSVAIVGASRDPEKVGGIVLKNIIDSKFTGKIYPVNPNAGNIDDLKCYSNIKDLPETVDLAIICLPSSLVLETLKEIGEKGIKNVLVFAAGFKEIGEEGEKLEKELINIANKFEINLLGPNCLGFVNNTCPINATFGELVKKSGNLRFISQSGALASSLFDWCKSIGLGFSHFITLGNKAVINENDVLEYFENQTQDFLTNDDKNGLSAVYPIGLYLESIFNGKEFLKIASKITQKNPVFILKPGKTKEGAHAMQSHTGAIAGEDSVLQAALQQANIIRCQTLEDFFDLAHAFSLENIPEGPKIAIVSNAGGPAVISSDAVIEQGLQLAEFDPQTKEELSKILPRYAAIDNPVDVLGDALADRYAKACEIILETNQAQSLLVILTPQIMTQIEKTAESLGALSQKYQKPIFCSFIGGNAVFQGEQKLNEYKIPSFRFPERAIATISAMWNFRKNQQKQERINAISTQTELNFKSAHEIIEKAISSTAVEQKFLDNLKAGEVVFSSGIQTPAHGAITDFDQARSFTQNYGWPIVLKLCSPSILHKTEVDGVIKDINNETELHEALNKLQQKIMQLSPQIRAKTQIQIQKQVLNGIEVIVGVKTDPTFGQVLLFGAGGTYAELFKDRNLHLLPININQAKELVEKSKIFPILNGSRNKKPYALDKLYELIVILGRLAQSVSEIDEIEINPAIVTFDNVWAVDTKIILK